MNKVCFVIIQDMAIRVLCKLASCNDLGEPVISLPLVLESRRNIAVEKKYTICLCFVDSIDEAVCIDFDWRATPSEVPKLGISTVLRLGCGVTYHS